MANAFEELLRVLQWVAAHTAEVSYPASFATVETPPTATGANDAYRFARVQAHDGDLVVARVAASGSAPTYGTGSIRVFQGTAEVLQLQYGDTLVVGGVGGAVHGAVIWGR